METEIYHTPTHGFQLQSLLLHIRESCSVQSFVLMMMWNGILAFNGDWEIEKGLIA